ncbi:MAG: SUMF1/EgtB/PvdO family nonheme iron enzyme, partial [Bacteroidota bacterium]
MQDRHHFRIVLLLFLLGAAAGAVWSCEAEPETGPPATLPDGMVWIDGNEDLPGFLMDATEVTTAAFRTFVEATDYVTEAEDFGWSGVFNYDSLGWLPVDGATWEYPLGPDSVAAAPDVPVTQLSLRDVRAYAKWAGKILPTEEQWMWAPFPCPRGIRHTGRTETQPTSIVLRWVGFYRPISRR